MNCPSCKTQLEKAILCNVEVDFCSKCLGIFFQENELEWAKDEKDRNLRWLNIDLWKEKEKFKISPPFKVSGHKKYQKICPNCRMPFYEVSYGDSDIKVDLCNICYGIWLDRGEFKKIIKYLKEKADFEILENYTKNLIKEFWEIFTGPKSLRNELSDFLTILKLLRYKFMVQHPNISKMILNLPK
ncbi:MAG TPA: hypothetical protein ENH06_00090 [bacterium]|nr:hypothetical protein [bacterium]